MDIPDNEQHIENHASNRGVQGKFLSHCGDYPHPAPVALHTTEQVNAGVNLNSG